MTTKEKILFNVIGCMLVLPLFYIMCCIFGTIYNILYAFFTSHPYLMIILLGLEFYYLLTKI